MLLAWRGSMHELRHIAHTATNNWKELKSDMWITRLLPTARGWYSIRDKRDYRV